MYLIKRSVSVYSATNRSVYAQTVSGGQKLILQTVLLTLDDVSARGNPYMVFAVGATTSPLIFKYLPGTANQKKVGLSRARRKLNSLFQTVGEGRLL